MRRLEARPEAVEGGLVLCSPAVGAVRGLPRMGDVLVPGQVFATLERLGARVALVVPANASGRVAYRGGDGRRSFGVSHGEQLLRLEPVGDAVALGVDARSADEEPGGPMLRAPMTGRFYARPAPDEPAFVSAGDVLEPGRTVGLLEVMKTFSRVLYEGDGLPPRAKVVRVVCSDGEDVEEGAPLFELEPAG